MTSLGVLSSFRRTARSMSIFDTLSSYRVCGEAW